MLAEGQHLIQQSSSSGQSSGKQSATISSYVVNADRSITGTVEYMLTPDGSWQSMATNPGYEARDSAGNRMLYIDNKFYKMEMW